MLEYLIRLDITVSALMAGLIPHNVVTNALFLFFSLNGLTVIIWGILLTLFIFWEEQHHKLFALYFLLSFITVSLLVNIVIKNVVKRDRPYITNQMNINYCPKTYSFPSGHAAGAFVGAVVFTHFDKKRRDWYYLVATIISFSRIYLYCHYLSDVLFGAYIGYMVSKIYIRYLTGNNKI